MNINQFTQKFSEVVASDNVTVNVNVRMGTFSYLDQNEASKWVAYLEQNEIPYKDQQLSGDTWTIQHELDGVQVTVWYNRIKTDKERLKELKEQVRALSEKMGVETDGEA